MGNKQKDICILAISVDTIIQVRRQTNSRSVNKNYISQKLTLVFRPVDMHQLALLQLFITQGNSKLFNSLKHTRKMKAFF